MPATLSRHRERQVYTMVSFLNRHLHEKHIERTVGVVTRGRDCH
jgi:hypothetical protein